MVIVVGRQHLAALQYFGLFVVGRHALAHLDRPCHLVRPAARDLRHSGRIAVRTLLDFAHLGASQAGDKSAMFICWFVGLLSWGG